MVIDRGTYLLDWTGGFEAAIDLSREFPLEKVPRPANQRPVLCLPYDPRLPGIAKILRKRHQALLNRDVNTREYLKYSLIIMMKVALNDKVLCAAGSLLALISKSSLNGDPASLSTNQLAQGVRVVLPLCECCAIYFQSNSAWRRTAITGNMW